jgi:cytochrome c biogenesis protein
MPGSKTGESGPSRTDSLFSEVTTFFTSVRTTIALLFLLAAASIVGTVIPQDVDLERLSQTAAPVYYRLTVILDLHQIYRSWWFLLLLILLSLNLLGCLLRRLPRIPEEWRGDSGKSSFSFTVSDSRSVQEVRGLLLSAVNPVLGSSPQETSSKDGLRLAWLKHRIYLLAFPLIHLAIIVILVGGLIGLLYGVKGSIQIKEGETGSTFAVIPSGKSQALPFQIALDKFTLKRYPTGEPQEFRSDVRILKDGKEIEKGFIRVNHPMTIEGISLYQADYRLLGVRVVNLLVADAQGKRTEIAVNPREATRLEGTPYKIRLRGLDPGSSEKGSWVEMSVEAEGESPSTVRIYKNSQEPHQLAKGAIGFLGYEPLYMSGLQVGYDPGTKVVWTGCALLIVGFYLTLFTNLRGLEIELKSKGKTTSARISGRSRKMRREFREKVEATLRDKLGAPDSPHTEDPEQSDSNSQFRKMI